MNDLGWVPPCRETSEAPESPPPRLSSWPPHTAPLPAAARRQPCPGQPTADKLRVSIRPAPTCGCERDAPGGFFCVDPSDFALLGKGPANPCAHCSDYPTPESRYVYREIPCLVEERGKLYQALPSSMRAARLPLSKRA